MLRTLAIVWTSASLALAACGPDAPGPPDTLPADVTLPDDTALPDVSDTTAEDTTADAAGDTAARDTAVDDTGLEDTEVEDTAEDTGGEDTEGRDTAEDTDLDDAELDDTGVDDATEDTTPADTVTPWACGPDGAVCDAPCYTAAHCLGDVCVGDPESPVDIDDGDPCTVDACDDGVVSHAPANGLDCTVADLCRGAGTCQDGDCVAPVVVTCDDGDPCTADTCDPATGACLTPPAEDGLDCAVADLCRGAGTCQDGGCVAPIVVTCDDGDPCTADTCDPATGACLTPDAEDGTTCDDQDACTSDDRCDAGQCGGAPVSPCCADAVCEAAEDCACGGCAEIGRCRCVDGDVDGDDLCADADNCDDVANADQLDTDDDGAGDACDEDDDGDGVPDDEDATPLDDTFCRDADEDGCDDCASGADDPAQDGDDADGDGICDLGDVCPGGDDTVDVDDDGVPDACQCTDFDALDTETHDLDGDPGDFGALYATTTALSAWSATRSNVIAKVHVYDRVAGAWRKTTLPSMYYGGAATLSLLRADGDVLWFAHRYPDAGSQGDRLYRYVAGDDAPVVTDLRDQQSDPGDIATSYVSVTSALAAFHTQRSNVVSRLFVQRRATDVWSVVTLPTRSSGGRAVMRAMAASGPLLLYGWDHPNTSTNGDVVNVYDADTDATASWDTQDIVSDPGDMLPATLVVTPALAAFHTQRSNVVSRILRYRAADGAWATVTLPTRSSGGRAVVKAIGAAGDLLFYAWDHPTASTNGDVVTVYDATTDSAQSWETQAIVSDPGDLVAAQVAVTPALVAFATKRSNVISRVLIYDRGGDGWSQVLLPTMYYGGRADLKAIYGAGERLYFVYPNPTAGNLGDRIYVYDATTNALAEVDTVDVQPDPGQIVVDKSAVTPDLFAFHTQRSNVVSRVFMYDACAASWRVDALPSRTTGGKAVVGTLAAAGASLVYTYDHPDYTVRGDVVSERRPCGCD